MTRPASPKACMRDAMRAFLCLLPAALAAAPAPLGKPDEPPREPPAAPRVFFSSTPWFAIAGEDTEGNMRAAQLASRLGRELEADGFRPADLAPGRVSLYISPSPGFPTLNTADGQTSVILPRASLSDTHACARALARAALHRLAQAAGRRADPAPWACEALAWQTRIAENPALLEQLQRLAATDELTPLADLDNLADAPPEQASRRSRAAFWLHRAIRRDNTADPRTALAEAAMGSGLETTLAKCVPDRKSGGEQADAWWPAAFLRETRERFTPVAGTAQSAEDLARLTRFVIRENDRDLPLDGPALIARREEPRVRDEARRRVLHFKARLPRANPIWHNALVAHGLFLEKLAQGEPEPVLRQLLNEALAEADIARTTSREVTELLAPAARP